MKKLIFLLSFVFVLGLMSVSAQDATKVVTPVKTEKVAKKAPKKNVVKKAPAKKTTKKVVTPAK